MRPQLAVVLTALTCLALGFLGGWVLGGDVGPAPSIHRDREAAPDGTRSREASALAPTRGAAGAREEARPEAAAPAPVSDAEVARATREAQRAASEDDDAPAGDLSISGVVIDRDGASIAGAVVQAVPREAIDRTFTGLPQVDPALGRGAPPSSSEEAARAARRALMSRRGASEAATGSDGTFEIGGVRAGRYRARGFAEGFDGDPVDVTAGQKVEIVLDRVRGLTIAPRLPDGSTPDAAVVVQHLQYNRTLLREWTPESPTIEVSEPVVELAVLAGDVMRTTQGNRVHATLQSGIKSVDVETESAEAIIFDLAPRAIVRAEVIESSVKRAGFHSWVSMKRVGSDDTLQLHLLEDGRWAAAVPDPGEYEVSVNRSTGTATASAVVAVAQGLTDVTLELPEDDLERLIEVTCVGPDGAPVRDVSFEVQYGGQGPAYSVGAVVPRPGGRYWISRQFLHPENAEIDGVTLIGASELQGSTDVWVPRGTPDATLRFSAPSEVIVLIQGDTAHRLGYVMVPAGTEDVERAIDDVTRDWTFWEGERIGVPIDAGRVTPGDYDFHLYSLATRNRGHRVLTRKVVLGPGETLVELECPPLDTFEVIVPGSRKWTQVRIEPLESTDANIDAPNAFAGEAGRATFTGVPPGRYRLEARVNNETFAAEITVPCGTVQLQPVEDGD